MKLFHAKGYANRILFLVGSAMSLIVVVVLTVRIVSAAHLPGIIPFFSA